MADAIKDIELKIRAAVEGVREVTSLVSELEGVDSQSNATATAAAKLDTALNDLTDLQSQIQRVRELDEQLNETGSSLDRAREKQKSLTQEVVASLGPSDKQLRDQQSAAAAVNKLEAALEKARDKQRGYTNQVIAANAPSAALLERQRKSTAALGSLEIKLFTARKAQEEANKAVSEGSEPSKRLTAAHEKATEKVERLSTQIANERAELDRLKKGLSDAGVEAKDFDSVNQRIAQTFDEVTRKARTFADAQSRLNFIPKEQLEREAQALRGSYQTLRDSGKLSAKELAVANLRLREGLLDLERRTNGWKDSLVKARIEIGATIAAFAPIAISIRQATEFESALADVRKVVSGTDEDFETLTEQIRVLSRELPISANGLAEIAAAGGQLGVPIEKLETFIRLSAKVSVAFNLTAEQAGQAIAKLSNVFGIPIEQVEKLGDAINALGNTTAAKEGEILEFLTRVGGSARTFGLTAEATAALGAAFISFGKAPQVAANAVNALLTRLQTANVQAPKAQEALGKIGISAETLGKQISENPQAALDRFLETLEGLDNQSRSEAVAQILGLEYADDISLLVNNLDQYRDALERATDPVKTAGALNNEFAERMQTLATQVALLKNILAETAVTLGDAFLPAIKTAVAAGKTVGEAIAEVVKVAPGLSAVAVSAVSLGAAMSGLKLAGAAARVGITALVSSITGLPGLLTGTAKSATAAGAAATTMGAQASGAAIAVSRLGAALRAVPYIALADQIGKLAIAHLEARDAAESLRQTEEALAQSLEDGIAEAQKRLTQYTAQANASGAAIEAIAAGVDTLGGAQIKYYEQTLAGAENYLRAQIAIAVREKELRGQTQIDLREISKNLREVRNARAELVPALNAEARAAEVARQKNEELAASQNKAAEAAERSIVAYDNAGSVLGEYSVAAEGAIAAGEENVTTIKNESDAVRSAADEQHQGALEIYDSINKQREEERKQSKQNADQHIQAEKDKSDATVESADIQKEATGGVAKYVFDLIGTYRTFFQGLSEEATEAFDHIVEKAAASRGPLLQFLEQLNKGVRELKRLHEDESARADSLIAQLSNVNTATRSTIITATRAAQAFDFVDKQRLDNLNAAIDGARSRMESLQDSARSTFESLRDELDRLQGNEEAIEARRRAAQRAQIQAQLATARTFGDRETVRQLEQSLAILQQIEREQRAIAQANGDTTSAARGQGFDTNSAQAGAQSNSRNSDPGFFQRPARTTRIEFVPPGSSTPISGDFDDDDADRLLDLLGQQKAVSTR